VGIAAHLIIAQLAIKNRKQHCRNIEENEEMCDVTLVLNQTFWTIYVSVTVTTMAFAGFLAAYYDTDRLNAKEYAHMFVMAIVWPVSLSGLLGFLLKLRREDK